ncbi:MAG: hypothetical protein M1822_005447 [Bathelium mastoideum]|nr:MAG: hypothetical protein M1822_005447 [Bathelium mastoideum]
MSKEAQSDEIQPIESAGTSDREAQDEELAMNKVLDDRITRKIDLHLVPIMTVMFMLAYLDRSNLGNAKIEGMLTDLHMVNRDYNVASLIFYVSYIVFEVPSNILLRKTSPSTWLSVLLFFWGISALSQGLTQSYGGLVCARFFIGVFEAGFTPGFLYLFSMYYTRYQLQKRLSLMFASGIIAGAFSGLLAYALVKMDGVGGYAGWRWIFIIEGLATIAVALVSKFVIVDWPNRATFLSQEDKTRLMIRLEHDAVRGIARMDTFDATAFSRIVGDWKIYVGAFMYFGAVNTGYVIALFLPTILKELGYTSSGAQIFSIPVYIVAAVCMLIIATLTDRLRRRYPFILVGCAVATVGYCILLAQTHVSVGIKYMAVFFVAAGGHSTHPITLGWLTNNVSGHYKRAISTAIQISIGNCAGFVGSNVFVDSQAPAYTVGYGVSLACIWLTVVMATIFLCGLRWENWKRERGEQDWRYNLPPEELKNLGDDHPAWRFVY